MAAAFVQGKRSNTDGTAPTCAPDSNITTGNVLWVWIQVRTGPVTTVADTGARTWTQQLVYHYTLDGNYYVELWTAPVGTGGTKPTVTVTKVGGSFITFDLIETSGTNTTTPIDVSAEAEDTNPSTLSAVTATAASNAALGMVFSGCDPGNNSSLATGFTAIDIGDVWVASAYKAATPSAAFTGTMDYTSGGSRMTVVALVVKESGGGGGGPTFRGLTLLGAGT